MGQEASRLSIPVGKKLSPEEESKYLSEKRDSFLLVLGLELLLNKRKDVLAEILETETNYVRGLEITVRVWLEPLRQPGMLTEEEVANIFSIIEKILAFHQNFLKQLQQVMKPGWTAQIAIGELFTKSVTMIQMSIFFFVLIYWFSFRLIQWRLTKIMWYHLITSRLNSIQKFQLTQFVLE